MDRLFELLKYKPNLENIEIDNCINKNALQLWNESSIQFENNIGSYFNMAKKWTQLYAIPHPTVNITNWSNTETILANVSPQTLKRSEILTQYARGEIDEMELRKYYTFKKVIPGKSRSLN